MSNKWYENYLPCREPYYSDDSVVLFHGSCLHIMDDINQECIRLIITDPPYGMEFHSNRPLERREKISGDTRDAAMRLISDAMDKFIRITATNSEIYLFCEGAKENSMLRPIWNLLTVFEVYFRIKNIIIWDKTFPGFGWDWRYQYETIFQLVKGNGIRNNSKRSSNILRFQNIIPKKHQHPTEKPVQLISNIIQAKTKKDDVVLDPFIGSGTTAVAAKNLGRKCIGIELRKFYLEYAANRLKQDVFDL